MENSQILFVTKPSLRRAYLFGFLYAATVLYGRYRTDFDPRFNSIWLGCFGIFIVLTVVVHLRRWCTNYIITNEDIQTASGILARRMSVVPLIRVTNAHAHQSFLERLLFLVTLRIDCAGGDSKEIIFHRITKDHAQKAAALIRQLRKQSMSPAQTQTDVAAQGY